MRPSSHSPGPLSRRRAERRRRALDSAALRAEFELERPRGLVARLKAYAASVEDLERARVHASLWTSLPRASASAEPRAARPTPAPRDSAVDRRD